jgi:hypothetical protein
MKDKMKNKYQDERWKKIEFDGIHPDEDIYISDFGRLKSFKTSRKDGKIIKGSWLSGYNIIVIKKTGKHRKTLFIHKLIASYFLEKPNEDLDIVVHLDYDKSNNHYQNLKWTDSKGAAYHRRSDKDYNKKKVRNAKLNLEDVVALKKMLKEGKERPYRIALKFGISHTQLSRISNGENWGHVKID